jgi:hypothetical protein
MRFNGKSLSSLHVADSILRRSCLQRRLPDVCSYHSCSYFPAMIDPTQVLWHRQPVPCISPRPFTLIRFVESMQSCCHPTLRHGFPDSLPYTMQISQLYFVRSLKHGSDIPCMDHSTPPHIQEWEMHRHIILPSWDAHMLLTQVLSRLCSRGNIS